MSESTQKKTGMKLAFVPSLYKTLVDTWKYHNISIFSNVFLWALSTVLGLSDQDIVKESDLNKQCSYILEQIFCLKKTRVELRKKKISFLYSATIPCCASGWITQI